MFDLYDLLDDPSGYGNTYFEADRRLMAASMLHERIESTVRHEVERQKDKIIDRTIKELQVFFNKHPFKI